MIVVALGIGLDQLVNILRNVTHLPCPFRYPFSFRTSQNPWNKHTVTFIRFGVRSTCYGVYVGSFYERKYELVDGLQIPRGPFLQLSSRTSTVTMDATASFLLDTFFITTLDSVIGQSICLYDNGSFLLDGHSPADSPGSYMLN